MQESQKNAVLSAEEIGRRRREAAWRKNLSKALADNLNANELRQAQQGQAQEHK